MKLKFEVSKTYNNNNLNDAVKLFLEKKDVNSLVNMLVSSLEYYMSKTVVKNVTLKIENTIGQGNFKDNVITINEKLFKTPITNFGIAELFIATFHELSHAMLYTRDLRILKTKTTPEIFMPCYGYKSVKYIIKKMTNNEHFAQGVKEWLYLQDNNELYAFKNSLRFTKMFFEDYFPSLVKCVPSYELYLGKKRENVLKKYPILQPNLHLINQIINDYQLKTASKNLNKLLVFEKNAIIQTMPITFTNEVREVLLNQIIECKNENIVVDFLYNPYFCLTDDEITKLTQVYDKQFIESVVFKNSPKTKKVVK